MKPRRSSLFWAVLSLAPALAGCFNSTTTVRVHTPALVELDVETPKGHAVVLERGDKPEEQPIPRTAPPHASPGEVDVVARRYGDGGIQLECWSCAWNTAETVLGGDGSMVLMTTRSFPERALRERTSEVRAPSSYRVGTRKHRVALLDFELVTPRENLLSVRQAWQPDRGLGGVFTAFGAVFTAGGAIFAVSLLTSSEKAGSKVGALLFDSTIIFGPGVIMLGSGLFNLFAPARERVLYRAP